MASVALDELDVFEEVCADCYRPAREAAAQGRKVAGYMCSYSPQELLHAAGYFPVRVIGRLGATPRADELLQSFICSFARSTFDAGLSGEFNFLEIMLFAHTCDTMQNLADLWQGNCPGMKTIITAMPNLHSGTASATYQLRASIRLYEQHREAMKSLYALRRACPEALSGTQMMSVILSSFLMPREQHLALITTLIDKLRNLPAGTASKRPKVVVGGSVCQAVDFIAAIEEAGCLVADDDLCMGRRSYLLPPSPGGDPMDALTRLYLSRDPCPAIHKPGFDPAVTMLERVRQSQSDGVIFLITKFCDPFGFDYPHINEQLEKAGIPSLMLEIEQHLPVPEQVRTRMEAFVEILQSRKGSAA
jgi:benzoyl-CoA reductase subunit C